MIAAAMFLGSIGGQCVACWVWYRIGYLCAEAEYRDHARREVDKAISTIRLRIEHAAAGHGVGSLDRDEVAE